MSNCSQGQHTIVHQMVKSISHISHIAYNVLVRSDLWITLTHSSLTRHSWVSSNSMTSDCWHQDTHHWWSCQGGSGQGNPTISLASLPSPFSCEFWLSVKEKKKEWPVKGTYETTLVLETVFLRGSETFRFDLQWLMALCTTTAMNVLGAVAPHVRMRISNYWNLQFTWCVFQMFLKANHAMFGLLGWFILVLVSCN